MAPLFGIAILHVVLLGTSSTAGMAVFICGGLLVAYVALTDALSSHRKTLVAGGVGVFVFASTFVTPINALLRTFIGAGDVASVEYDPKLGAPGAYPERGVLVRLPVSRDGHYRVGAYLMSMKIDLLVDTGASITALTYEDAVRVYGPSIRNSLRFNIPVQTANGETHAAHLPLSELRIGKIVVREGDVMVAQPGALSQSLLGMSFLGRLTRFEVGGGQLILYQEQ